MSLQIEVRMIGQVDDGGLIRDCLVFNSQRIVISERVTHGNFKRPRVPFFTIRAKAAQLRDTRAGLLQ
ncbi:hypothetical protein GCM10007052_20710 [Halioglobus japonicus]|nr:hypothetical protein GCM10007052_20710 [Halioglobus japonicus]